VEVPELHERPASELAALITSGTASSREILADLMDRVEAVEPSINAVTCRMYEQAEQAAADADDQVARGAPLSPLHGVPVSIKDQFEVLDTPATRGLPSRADHRSTREGPLLGRLRGAGAIPFVKTNVPVMSMEGETHNPLYGRTNNPYDLDRAPGGSSGGEGALLAARGTPLGIGSDIGGSLRVPAHYCGITTIKATSHRLPWGDNPPEFDEWQEAIVPQVGPMARTVADVALAFRVLAAPDNTLPPEPFVPPLPVADPAAVTVSNLVVGVCEDDGGMRPSPAVRRAVREAADALTDAGARVVEWTPPPAEQVYDLYATLLGGDGFRHLRRAIGDDPLSRVTRLLTGAGHVPRPLARGAGRALRAAGQQGAAATVRNAGQRSFDVYSDALLARKALLRRVAASLHGPDAPDVILMPPQALPALRHGAFRDLTWSLTSIFLANLTGLPAGVVPVTTVRVDEESDRRPGADVVERLARSNEQGTAGLPVGVQVLAPWWREDLVLAAMAAIEARVGPVPAPGL
jgi:fatty acid amide hydrolase